ncbi:hypothetical protein MYXO_00435 [Myxococcaceae bacterium]|nr:hypothetical protein MYXO_00435 [Myxococcaceae bacterium]
MWAVTLACCIGSAPSAVALELMPSFATLPTGWVTDRYEPHSFTNIGTFQGRSDVLEIEIDPAEGLTSRPSGYQSAFYNTQGRQYALSGGAGSTLSADLWIPSEWSDAAANGSVRTDLWGVTVDGASYVSGYPIIGFTNYGGAARYRVWQQAGTWLDLATPVAYDDWTAFSIEFTGTEYRYSIDGTLVYTETDPNSSVGFSATILQAYNFYDSAIAPPVNAQPYSAHWSNAAVIPEPGTLLLVAAGTAGLAVVSRRRS